MSPTAVLTTLYGLSLARLETSGLHVVGGYWHLHESDALHLVQELAHSSLASKVEQTLHIRVQEEGLVKVLEKHKINGLRVTRVADTPTRVVLFGK